MGLGGLLLQSCGPRLDPISQIKTLRIIGVWKSHPYARPGETVDLNMLWEDGVSRGPRTDEVSSFFGFWCVNPPGGQYSGCLGAPPAVSPQFAVNTNDFSLRIPEDSLRPPAVKGLPPSGIAYVFYGVCAGNLSVAGREVGPDDPARSFDLGGVMASMGGQAGAPSVDVDAGALSSLLPSCVDDEGETLGAEDFVVGYSAIQIYEELRNGNPILLPQFEVNGQRVQVDCVNEGCDEPMPIPDRTSCEVSPGVGGAGGAGAALPVACFSSCEGDGVAELCPGVSIKPVIDREATQEQDPLARGPAGDTLQESIWVSYLVDRGGLGAELKLVNDAKEGWNTAYGTSYLAPDEEGPVRIWAVVRDNRGGVAWMRLPGYVR